jgi:hypothetical protein
VKTHEHGLEHLKSRSFSIETKKDKLNNKLSKKDKKKIIDDIKKGQEGDFVEALEK